MTISLDGAHRSGNYWCWSLRKTLQPNYSVGKAVGTFIIFPGAEQSKFINKTLGNLLNSRKLGCLLQESSLLCMTVLKGSKCPIWVIGQHDVIQ